MGSGQLGVSLPAQQNPGALKGSWPFSPQTRYPQKVGALPFPSVALTSPHPGRWWLEYNGALCIVRETPEPGAPAHALKCELESPESSACHILPRQAPGQGNRPENLTITK